MAIGDILSNIGTGLKRGLEATGEVAKSVVPEIGLTLTGQAGPLDAEKRRRANQLADLRTQVLGQSIEDALKTEQDPQKRTALYQQLEKLVAPPAAQPTLVQKLHKIVHPNGAPAAGPVSQGPDKLASMLGQVGPPAAKAGVKVGTKEISGADLEGQHDVFGNPTDPKKVYTFETDAQGKVIGLIPTQPRTSGVPRVLPPISMSAAKKMAEQGISFTNDQGEPLDVTQFDNTMQVVPVKMGNSTTYTVTSQGQTHLNVGNMVYAVPKLEQTNLATEGVGLGPSKVGTTTTRQGIGVDANGNPVKQQFTGTSTPATVGVQGAQQAPQARQPMVPRVSTSQPSNVAPRPSVAQKTPSPAGGQPAFMTPQMYNQQLNIARPVRVAANQIFGDPQQPDFKPLSEYGDVMNNPGSVQRIGAAARLMINDMASVDATKEGGLWTLIQTSGGLPQALAQAQSDQTRQAVGKLQPREKELLNAEMDAYGAIIGLRAITKGSAARFSAQSLEREVPIPGLSAFDAFTFYDKLGRLAEEVYSGSKGLSSNVLPEKAYYQQQFDKLQQLKQQYRPGRGTPVIKDGKIIGYTTDGKHMTPAQ